MGSMGRSPRNITHLPLLDAVCTATLSVNCTVSRAPLGSGSKRTVNEPGLTSPMKIRFVPTWYCTGLLRQPRQHRSKEIHRDHPLAIYYTDGLRKDDKCFSPRALYCRLIAVQVVRGQTIPSANSFSPAALQLYLPRSGPAKAASILCFPWFRRAPGGRLEGK